MWLRIRREIRIWYECRLGLLANSHSLLLHHLSGEAEESHETSKVRTSAPSLPLPRRSVREGTLERSVGTAQRQ
jgi:hypothetical protein